MLAVTGAVGGLVPGGGQAADLVDGQRDQRAVTVVQDGVAGTAWRNGVTVCADVRAPSVAGPPAAGPPGFCRPDGGGRQAAAVTARNAGCGWRRCRWPGTPIRNAEFAFCPCCPDAQVVAGLTDGQLRLAGLGKLAALASGVFGYLRASSHLARLRRRSLPGRAGTRVRRTWRGAR